MMRREIGGYLELEQLGSGRPYREGGIALDSARSCLAYLIELRGIRRLLIPDYMCDAVRLTCEACGVEARIYRVGADLLPEEEIGVEEGEWLYLADFFGQLPSEKIYRASELTNGRLIVDEVQGFFRDPWDGADTIYTCRKFFGVADGAYLFTADGQSLGRILPQAESASRMFHVLGRLERNGAEFYGAYREAESSLSYGEPKLMSKVTEDLLGAIDYKAVRGLRERNFALLHALFGQMNALNVRKVPGPYMYPLLVLDATGVREDLAAEGIYIPTLWPNVLLECPKESSSWKLAMDILPLPVDQRYGLEDMEYLASKVKHALLACNRK